MSADTVEGPPRLSPLVKVRTFGLQIVGFGSYFKVRVVAQWVWQRVVESSVFRGSRGAKMEN